MYGKHCFYVGTVGEGLWRSLDGGETFVRCCDGMFVECHVRALAAHPVTPQTLYLGNEHGLYLSRDGGDSWTRCESPLNDQQIWSILLSPHDPDLILVGTCPSRLYRSEDGGRSWSQGRAEIETACPRILATRVTTLLADPHDAAIFWAGIEIDGLRRSHDGGQSWEPIGQGLSSRDIHALHIVVEEGRRRRYLAATNNDLNLSIDDGVTWEPLHIGRALPWSYCRALVQPVGRAEEILLGHGNGPPGSAGVIGRSVDGGETWQTASMPGLANSTIWSFAVHPADPELLYASSVSGELYRSTDGGASWDKLHREFGEIRALLWTP